MGRKHGSGVSEPHARSDAPHSSAKRSQAEQEDKKKSKRQPDAERRANSPPARSPTKSSTSRNSKGRNGKLDDDHDDPSLGLPVTNSARKRRKRETWKVWRRRLLAAISIACASSLLVLAAAKIVQVARNGIDTRLWWNDPTFKELVNASLQLEHPLVNRFNNSFVARVRFEDLPEHEHTPYVFPNDLFEDGAIHYTVRVRNSGMVEGHSLYRNALMRMGTEDIYVPNSAPVCTFFDGGPMYRRQCLEVIQDFLGKMCQLPEGSPKNVTQVQMQKLLHETPVHFISGTTVLAIFKRSDHNIAHFAGRIMYVFHLLMNHEGWRIPEIQNIIITVQGQPLIWDMLVNHSKGIQMSWQGVLTEIITYPDEPIMENVSKFLKNDTSEGGRRVLIVNQLADLTAHSSVRFERLVTAGFLKGRFFVEDMNLPRREQRTLPARPIDEFPGISADSWKFHSQVEMWSRGDVERAKYFSFESGNTISLRIVFLHRAQSGNTLRMIDQNSFRFVVDTLREFGRLHNIPFEVVTFDNMTVYEQIRTMRHVSLAIGIHGANLVNSLYMPRLAALLEIFPFKFDHEMYRNGGQGSLWYDALHLAQGVHHPSVTKGTFASAEACILASTACKKFYRDAKVSFSAEDKKQFILKVTGAIKYLSELLYSSRNDVP
ncbi:hypothetical protein FVE85_0298 [Porphyridium purpureum]|uniref:Glycosyltransferase 61 catalytic domain-containing protein n=1 Tax=Porphyridium purpureum TaxID=35688 RepID=A0A5J4YY87_PORPP|nr:hypothetical protein FVE85_0298 [Porphyridium purpureum]|eukprot:POR5993..scf208_2